MPGASSEQFGRCVAEATLIEDEEVEAGEVRFNEGELLTQRSLRQAQRRGHSEPIEPAVKKHERAVVAATGEIEAGDEHGVDIRTIAHSAESIR